MIAVFIAELSPDFYENILYGNQLTKDKKNISINGVPVKFTYQENRYRKGGAMIPKHQLLAILGQQENTVEIQL